MAARVLGFTVERVADVGLRVARDGFHGRVGAPADLTGAV